MVSYPKDPHTLTLFLLFVLWGANELDMRTPPSFNCRHQVVWVGSTVQYCNGSKVTSLDLLMKNVLLRLVAEFVWLSYQPTPTNSGVLAVSHMMPLLLLLPPVYPGVQWCGHPGHDRQELRGHLLRQPPWKPGADRGNRLREDLQDGG